jgi:hypothetical protein
LYFIFNLLNILVYLNTSPPKRGIMEGSGRHLGFTPPDAMGMILPPNEGGKWGAWKGEITPPNTGGVQHWDEMKKKKKNPSK